MNFNKFMCFHHIVILYTHLPSLYLWVVEPSFFLFLYLLFVPGFLFPAPPGIRKYSRACEIQPWIAFEEGVTSY